MSNQSRSTRGTHVWRNERLDRQSAAGSAGTSLWHRLSFLSLKVAVNGYPDTGESRDAYNIESTVERDSLRAR
jgi:hypothetical protein